MESGQDISGITYLVAIGAGLIMLLMGIVVLYSGRAQQKLLRQQLALKEMETQHQTELINNSILVLEDERARFAKDLHDDIGSIFSALRLQVNQLDTTKDAKAKETVLISRDIIDSGIQSVRQISHNIAPPDLEMFGLPDILETYCERHSNDQFTMTFSFDHPYHNLPKNTELGLYRITQELGNNAIRHANASKIRLELRQHATGATFSYSDNGKGFDFEAVYRSAKAGLGLRNIEARVHHINGQIDWETRPGNGLAVHITLPNQ